MQVRPIAARAPPQVDARLCAELDAATLEVTSRKRRIVEMEKEVAELRRQQEDVAVVSTTLALLLLLMPSLSMVDELPMPSLSSVAALEA